MAGWAVGMVYGTLVAFNNPKVGDPGSHFGSPLNEFPFTDHARLHRLHGAAAQPARDRGADVPLRALNVSAGVDQTRPEDYRADIGDEGVEEELDPLATESHS